MSTVHELDIPPNAIVVEPPFGFVALQASNATDLDVVNAARVSFSKQSKWEYATDKVIDYIDLEEENEDLGYLSRADEGVLRYLLRGKHGTPFEHTFFKFHIRAPIFVFREWHRHRIGVSINEESARYTPLKGDFWLPTGDAVRVQRGRPGAYTFEPVNDDEFESFVRDSMAESYRLAYDTYLDLMAQGLAKEVARAVLPVGIYSQMIWTCNARSLMNFLALRNDPPALREIRIYAAAMEEIFARAMPITHDAFVRNGRVAP